MFRRNRVTSRTDPENLSTIRDFVKDKSELEELHERLLYNNWRIPLVTRLEELLAEDFFIALSHYKNLLEK